MMGLVWVMRGKYVQLGRKYGHEFLFDKVTPTRFVSACSCGWKCQQAFRDPEAWSMWLDHLEEEHVPVLSFETY